MANRFDKEITRWSTLRCSDERERFGVIAERMGNIYQVKHITNREKKFFCEICGRYHSKGICSDEDILRIKAKNIYSWLKKNKYTEE